LSKITAFLLGALSLSLKGTSFLIYCLDLSKDYLPLSNLVDFYAFYLMRIEVPMNVLVYKRLGSIDSTPPSFTLGSLPI